MHVYHVSGGELADALIDYSATQRVVDVTRGSFSDGWIVTTTTWDVGAGTTDPITVDS
jgi:hypothetical protein